jgi:hypothetical protein
MRIAVASAGALFLLGFAGAASAQWMFCDDRIVVTVDGSTVHVEHIGALYNCCPDGFAYDVNVEPGRIDIFEHEILSIPCTCLCCIDLGVDILDVPAGDYTLYFSWLEYDTGQWEVRTREITVPEVGQGNTSQVGPTSRSPCYEPGTPVDPEQKETTWGRMKALYK